MAEVKPAEISAILKQQLSGFEASASLDEVGSVLTIGALNPQQPSGVGGTAEAPGTRSARRAFVLNP